MASASAPSDNTTSVQSSRIRILKERSRPLDREVGPVVYWMFRDQRIRDNWALIHAVDQGNKANAPVAVAFNLFDQFLGAKARQLGFMLRGLKQLQEDVEEILQIPFFLFQASRICTFAMSLLPFMSKCYLIPTSEKVGWKRNENVMLLEIMI